MEQDPTELLPVEEQLELALTRLGHDWRPDATAGLDGPVRYAVDGVTYTVREAAERFLPGGWAGAVGRTVQGFHAALDILMRAPHR